MKRNSYDLIPVSIVITILFLLANGCSNTPDYEKQPPILTTSPVLNITPSTAECGGNIFSNGGTEIKARGVCWSTNPTPGIIDSKTVNGTGTGNFTSTLTGLTPNTIYYVRAYAVNNSSIGYGKLITFKTQVPQIPVLTTLKIKNIGGSNEGYYNF